MNTPTLKEQILDTLEKMSEGQQQEVLNFAKKIQRPQGVPFSSLLKFVGSISPDDLKLMEEAIEDFEKVNLDEW